MWILAGVAGLCIFLNSLHGELIFDDVHAVQRNKDVLGGTTLSQIFLNDFWGEPISSNSSHKSYRPFTVLTFRANHMIHGMHPTGYHFVNVAFHAIVSGLSERVFTVLLKDSAVAETAALLFALHPVHCEAVASIVGRAEVFGALFALLAVLALPPLFEQGSTQIRRSKSEGELGGANDAAVIRDRNVRMGRGEDAHENREAHALERKLDSASVASGELLGTKWGWILAAGACSIMATLSKETGATVLLFFIARDILDIYTAYVFRAAAFHHTHTHAAAGTGGGAMPLPLSNTYSISADKWLHRHLWNAGGRIVAAAALFCSILGARKWLTGARFGPEFSKIDNPFYYMEGGVEWMLSISVLHGVYARLLLLPTALSADYSFDCIPQARGITDARVLFALALYLCLVARTASDLYFLAHHACEDAKRASADAKRASADAMHASADAMDTASDLYFLTHHAHAASVPQPSHPQTHLAAAAAAGNARGVEWRRRRGQVECVMWGLMTFLPASHLLLPLGTLVAERLLYLPSLAFCGLFAIFIHTLDFLPPPLPPQAGKSTCAHAQEEQRKKENEETVKQAVGAKQQWRERAIMAEVFAGGVWRRMGS